MENLKQILIIGLVALVCGGVVFWSYGNYRDFFDNRISKPTPLETNLRGFCVDNDKGIEMYKFSYELQHVQFVTRNCSFDGMRQDIIGCLGDDFYSYLCI